MSDINKRLQFEKLKTDWEHHRATVFNYAIGLITIFIFGLKNLVIDMIGEGNILIAIVFSSLIGILFLVAIWIISDRMKKIRR